MAAGLLDLFGEFLEMRPAPCEQRHLRALLAKSQRDIVPDSARSASHHHRLVAEVSEHGPLRFLSGFRHERHLDFGWMPDASRHPQRVRRTDSAPTPPRCANYRRTCPTL